MTSAFHRLLRVAVFGALTLLAACGARVELLSAVNETEANEVLSALLDAKIDAQKVITKAGAAINVDGTQVARALDVLHARGLPRERFDGMGQIFRKEGLVSSPLEERARYVYALSQELTNTLSQMDGVLAARVHVVLPERGGVGEITTPSTAAVFIKHQAGYSLDALQPQMRKLVTHSIPGLTEDRVSVTLVSAQPVPDALREGVAAPAPAQGAPAAVVWVLGALVALLLAALGALAWRMRGARVKSVRTDPATAA